MPGNQDEDTDGEILISGLQTGDRRTLSRNILADIIGARLEEILDYCRLELEHCGLLDYLAAGMVLTGSASMMPNILDFAEEFLGMPVRRGELKDFAGVPVEYAVPGYMVSLGLPVYGYKHHEKEQDSQRERGGFAEVAGGFLGWLANIF
jgi:cell division protein FtsA